MTDIIRKNVSIMKTLLRFDEEHPYILSFLLALAIMIFILFWSGPGIVFDSNTPARDELEFVDIKTLAAPKREVKQEISTEKGEVTEAQTVNRAKGSASDQPVDLAFYPNVTPPRVVGRLRRDYPKIAEEDNIQAKLFLRLLIDTDGKVKRVDVLRVRLSKKLPDDVSKKMKAAFIRDAKKILFAARFTPTIINGKKSAIVYEFPLDFELD